MRYGKKFIDLIILNMDHLVMKLKSREEFEGQMQAFPDGYKTMFGEDLNLNDVKAFALKEIEKLKVQRIQEAFSGLHPSSYMQLIKYIDELLEKPKKKKSVK